jgi:uncharacterized protein YajQ (UPF0234 family)
MADHSFDIVSKVDMQEVINAINQAEKEVGTRFDLKDSGSEITLKESEKKIHLVSSDDYKIKAVLEILNQKLLKRNVSIKAFKPGDIESRAGNTVKQEITIQSGLSQEHAKTLIRDIKDEKFKVQTQIQGDQIRVVAKKIDDLQSVIQFIRGKNYPFDVQAINYR